MIILPVSLDILDILMSFFFIVNRTLSNIERFFINPVSVPENQTLEKFSIFKSVILCLRQNFCFGFSVGSFSWPTNAAGH